TVVWGEKHDDGRPNIAELQEVLERVQEAGGIDYGSSGFANVKAALDALVGVRIVEMGSNENGEYVRWENGLQVCFGWVVVFTGDGTSEIKTGTKNLPASFASGAALWAGNEAPYWRIYPTVATGAVTTSFGWQAERKSGIWTSGLNYPIHFIAVGR